MADRKKPEKIQRPLTSWIIYCNEHRGAIKEANPTFGFKDIAHALSEGFKSLSEEERAVYDLKASQEKERFSLDILYLLTFLEVQPRDERISRSPSTKQHFDPT
jgi:hypothetical protein